MTQCRFCQSPLEQTLVDLGNQPLANSFLDGARATENTYPLHARVCGSCFLVQVEDAVPAEAIFSDYAYFSSYAESWVEHARDYAEAMCQRFGLDAQSRVVEVASNDGYLLQHFAARDVPVLGVEPAANIATVAREKGVATEVAFFGEATATRLKTEGHGADLLAANNVLAHVPDLNDFVQGFSVLLKPDGVLTVEFPHVLNLIELGQFDTIYHEHYSYLSLLTVERIFQAHGLRVFDVDEIPTHGGSLRVYACHDACAAHNEGEGLGVVRNKERAAKLDTLAAYDGFTPRVEAVRKSLLEFLESAKADSKTVVAYGAAAKGNTLLNYCGVGDDLIACVVDANPHKQGRFLPGSRLAILAPEHIGETQPDFVLILPWNLKQEIMGKMGFIRDWGGKFVVAIPELEVTA